MSGRPFKKGQSGNPGGRRKKTDAERRAEQLIAEGTPDAAQTLLAIMRDPTEDAKTRIHCAKLVLEHSRVNGEEGLALSVEDLDQADLLALYALVSEAIGKDAKAMGLIQ